MTEIKTIKNDNLFEVIEKFLHDGMTVNLRIKGFSMRPFLRNNQDIAHLKAIDQACIKEGMVVLFKYNNTHTLHRIIKIDGEQITMQGDGNYRSCEIVSRSAIIAFVESIECGGKIIKYNTALWRALSKYSLTIKAIRTKRIDIVRAIKHRLGIKE